MCYNLYLKKNKIVSKFLRAHFVETTILIVLNDYSNCFKISGSFFTLHIILENIDEP